MTVDGTSPALTISSRSSSVSRSSAATIVNGAFPSRSNRFMRATANQAVRGTETPVYHLSVSLAPGETLDRATLEGVADRLLRDLGLEKAQQPLLGAIQTGRFGRSTR